MPKESIQNPMPLGKLLLQISKMYNSDANQLLNSRGHDGLSLAHTALVFNLETGGTKCTTVTKRAGIKRQSMAELARDLEEREYIKQVVDPNDKRAQLFLFTKLGLKFQKDAQDVIKMLEKKYEKMLGSDVVSKIRETTTS